MSILPSPRIRAVVPEHVVTVLLNAGQEVMVRQFDTLVIQTGSPRLWRPGAYVGTYGELANSQIQAYLGNWRAKTPT
jgi:hypothetical protein